MFITWLFYLKDKNPGVVDVSWGIGILLSGIWYLFHLEQTLPVYIIGSLLILWACRLSGFLWYTRVRPKHIEKRYFDIAKSWSVRKDLGFLGNFLIQAFLLSFIAIPFLFMDGSQTQITIIQMVASVVIVIGILGEALADQQLYRFKKENTKANQICEKGLWYYSRHPNYFFEIVTWIGFSLFVIEQPYGYIAFISPITLVIIMVFITGRITERVSVQSKGEQFIQYQQSTSMIVPWFKKSTR